MTLKSKLKDLETILLSLTPKLTDTEIKSEILMLELLLRERIQALMILMILTKWLRLLKNSSQEFNLKLIGTIIIAMDKVLLRSLKLETQLSILLEEKDLEIIWEINMVLEPLLIVSDNSEPLNSEELISSARSGLLDMDIPSPQLPLAEMD